MAVEARRLNLFSPQILSSREFVMNAVEGHGNVFGAQMGYVAPLSGTTTATTEMILPMYGSAITGTAPAKITAMRSDSSLTCAVPISRKRSRDEASPPLLLSSFPSVAQNQIVNNRCGSFTFLGEDISHQIHQQQLEIDRFISQHTEKVRMEIEERRRSYSRRIALAVEENVMKKLKLKEEEIEKMGKLNWALEERVKSLFVENQLWKNLAHSNEATANALRSNLEQVLAQAQDEQHRADEAALTEDALSYCGSNYEETDGRTLAECASTGVHGGELVIGNVNRMCRNCGKDESCVLLLPCRHLCLCTVCGSSVHTCPVCNSVKTASVHVNLT